MWEGGREERTNKGNRAAQQSTHLGVFVHVAHGLQVGLARHAGHGHIRVDNGGVLLVAHDVERVGLVVPHADEDGPGAVGGLQHLLGVRSVDNSAEY